VIVFAVGSVIEDISSTGPTSDQSVSVAALRRGNVENRTSGIANSVLTAAALIANNAPTKERLPEGSTLSPSFVWGVSSIDPLLNCVKFSLTLFYRASRQAFHFGNV
jgi:hypothetical protein